MAITGMSWLHGQNLMLSRLANSECQLATDSRSPNNFRNRLCLNQVVYGVFIADVNSSGQK